MDDALVVDIAQTRDGLRGHRQGLGQLQLLALQQHVLQGVALHQLHGVPGQAVVHPVIEDAHDAWRVQPDQGLELSLAGRPDQDDVVLSGEGIAVFLEPIAAEVLDDKVLDVQPVAGADGKSLTLNTSLTVIPSFTSPSFASLPSTVTFASFAIAGTISRSWNSGWKLGAERASSRR